MTTADEATTPAHGGTAIRRTVSAWLIPESRNGRRLAAVAFLDSLGSGMYYTVAALYFVKIVGLSIAQVGLGLSIGGLVGLLGGVPVGILADRLRAGQVFIALQLLRGVCYTLLCFVSGFGLYAVTAAMIGLTDATIPPLNQAVISSTVPSADRVVTLARIRAVRNVSFGLGALIAVGAIGAGSRFAFLLLIGGNALSYFVAAGGLRAMGIQRVRAGPAVIAKQRFTLVTDMRYLGAAALNGILAIHTTILTVALPLWFTQHTRMPPSLLGILLALNSALTVMLQARLAKSSQTIRGAARTAVLAGIALAGFGVASQLASITRLAWAAAVLAVVAVVLLTGAEMWQSGSSWTVSYDLANPHRRAAYLSTFQLGSSVQATVGPWLLTSVVFRTRDGWLLFGLITIVAGSLVAVVLRRHVGQSAGDAVASLQATESA